MPVASRKRLLLMAVLLLSGCGNSKDQFFDAPSSEWVKRARELSLDRQYELYREQASWHPPLTNLAEALGEHGREAIIVWLRDLEQTGRMHERWQYGGLIRAANRRGGYDLCADHDLYNEVVDAIVTANHYRRRDIAINIVQQSCFRQPAVP